VEGGALAGLPFDYVGLDVGEQVAAMQLDEMAGFGWGERGNDHIEREMLAADEAIGQNAAEDFLAAVLRDGKNGGQIFCGFGNWAIEQTADVPAEAGTPPGRRFC
jgi:hypothetical protein